MSWTVVGDEAIGARDVQQDTFRIWRGRLAGSAEETVLMLVADGMGGHDAGEQASAFAADAFIKAFETHAGPVAQRLHRALEHANSAVRQLAKRLDAKTGTTMTAAVLDDDRISWISVGDSPLWLREGAELIRLNADHSLRGTADIAGGANALRSALTGSEVAMIDQSDRRLDPARSYAVVAASDGILTLDPAEIRDAVAIRLPPKNDDRRAGTDSAGQAVAHLLAGIARCGDPRQDNTTVVVAMRSPAAARRTWRWDVIVGAVLITLGVIGVILALQ